MRPVGKGKEPSSKRKRCPSFPPVKDFLTLIKDLEDKTDHLKSPLNWAIAEWQGSGMELPTGIDGEERRGGRGQADASSYLLTNRWGGAIRIHPCSSLSITHATALRSFKEFLLSESFLPIPDAATTPCSRHGTKGNRGASGSGFRCREA